ncbi:hypothetical protein GALMADRAFT_160688 [Galerina marginata CBS 339.88]|uniref:Uncharacterized protein n=1 Tax=Galerina marginata (strain CBS 339.88) TaxID=685588 RepID=A0A067SN63_GALM3|nr:hypothetical protein GALMADRAFT_160688 [Galerina marginata CBS 339.88]
MSVAFTVTLPPTVVSDEAHDNSNEAPVKREIWLKSTSPFVVGQIGDIALEMVHDNDSNGVDPLASELSFAIAIGEEIAQAAQYTQLAKGVLFPASSTIRVDTETERPFLWAGRGAKAVKGSAYSVSLTEDSEIASSLSAGNYIYLRITVGVEADPQSTDLELSPGMERAPALSLGILTDVWTDVIGGVGAALNLVGPGKNVVPKDSPNEKSELRQVLLGRHPVLGPIGCFVDKWVRPFKKTEQHWAVFVGGYYHELGVNRKLNVVYRNGKVQVGDKTFELEDVGYTIFNDQAIVDAGDIAIGQMDPKYEVETNNCHKFAINLLTNICLVGRKLLDTSYAPEQQVEGPKFNEETEKFEVEETPAPVAEEKPPVTTVSTQLYYAPCAAAGSRFTNDNVPLTKEERKELLDRAAEIMGGTA